MIVPGLWLQPTCIAAVGDFPLAFVAVYLGGAIAAFGIGFLALQKAREVNAANLEKEDTEQQ